MVAGATIVLVLLLLLSAVLSAAETAVFSVTASHVRTVSEEGFDGSEALAELHERPDAFRYALIFGNVVLNVVAAGIIVAAAVQAWGTAGAWIAIPSVAVGIVFLVEVLPRVLAARRPVSLALSVAPTLRRLERVLRPILLPVSGIGEMLDRQDGPNGSAPGERELKDLTDLGEEEGVVGQEERDLVERAFRLDERKAWDVMTPRVAIFAWDDSLTLGEIIDEVKTIPYSRVPVYRDSIDDVTGILYVREAYQAYVAGHRGVPLARLARDPLFVPGSVPLTRLLRDFQARRIHMGIIADEFGGTDGLVTLEDVLEELVGEIHDETDEEQELLVRVGRGEIVVSGNTELREIHHAYNVPLPYLEHRNVNGFLLEALGHVPEAGERLELDDCSIEVVEASDTQVLRAHIRLGKSAERSDRPAAVDGPRADGPDADGPEVDGPGADGRGAEGAQGGEAA